MITLFPPCCVCILTTTGVSHFWQRQLMFFRKENATSFSSFCDGFPRTVCCVQTEANCLVTSELQCTRMLESTTSSCVLAKTVFGVRKLTFGWRVWFYIWSEGAWGNSFLNSCSATNFPVAQIHNSTLIPTPPTPKYVKASGTKFTTNTWKEIIS